jgi:hypothetical protein
LDATNAGLIGVVRAVEMRDFSKDVSLKLGMKKWLTLEVVPRAALVIVSVTPGGSSWNLNSSLALAFVIFGN